MRKFISTLLLCYALLIPFSDASAQSRKTAAKQPTRLVHELAPFIGLYAPDRFENSIAVGVRYFYRLSARHAAGLIFGYSNAGQDFTRNVLGAAPVAGSDRVFYHGARFSRNLVLRGRVRPYLATQLGLTSIHEEHNLTLGFGLGTRVLYRRNLNLRYEIMWHLFRSGVDNTAWTNSNLEIAFAFGFYL